MADNERVYVPAIKTFKPHSAAPSFILGTVVIDLNSLFTWLKGEGAQYITEYGEQKIKQLKLTALQSDKNGINFQVDTFKPQSQQGKITPNPDAMEKGQKTSATAQTPNSNVPF